MTLKKLKPGMTVYEVKRATWPAKVNWIWEWWDIKIKEVDEEKERVLASRSGAVEEWYYKPQWSKWRMNRPEE